MGTPTLIAKRYEILRGIPASGRVSHPVPEKPLRVATLLNEAAFLKHRSLEHNRTVFLEERFHDWTWKDGQFTYYSRVAEKADVILVYELENAPGTLGAKSTTAH